MRLKSEYLYALQVVSEYEEEQKALKSSMELVTYMFPIGCFVISKLNSEVRGVVSKYGSWNGIVQLHCIDNSSKKNKILFHNAVKI